MIPEYRAPCLGLRNRFLSIELDDLSSLLSYVQALINTFLIPTKKIYKHYTLSIFMQVPYFHSSNKLTDNCSNYTITLLCFKPVFTYFKSVVFNSK